MQGTEKRSRVNALRDSKIEASCKEEGGRATPCKRNEIIDKQLMPNTTHTCAHAHAT